MKALDKDQDGKLNQEEVKQIYKYFKENFTAITGKTLNVSRKTKLPLQTNKNVITASGNI